MTNRDEWVLKQLVHELNGAEWYMEKERDALDVFYDRLERKARAWVAGWNGVDRGLNTCKER